MRPLCLICLGIGLSLWSGDATARRPHFALNKILAQAETDRSATKLALKGYINDNSSRSDRDQAMLHLGELQRLDGLFGKSRFWFQKIIDEFPTSAYKNSAQVGLMLVQAQDNTLSGNGLGVLQLHKDLELPNSMKAEQLRLLALNSDSMDEAKRYAAKAAELAEGYPQIEERINRDLGLYLAVSGESSENLEEQLLTQLLQAMDNQSYAQAESLASNYASQFPEGLHIQTAKAIQKRAAANDPYNYRKVGVLLPLTGDYAHFSSLLKSSLEYASQSSNLDLIWYDTEGNADKAVSGVEQLTTVDGCGLIIGPLLHDTATPAAEAAQAYQVPMLSFSQSDEITQTGDYIFRAFVSTTDQINALLNHAVDAQGWNRFTVLAPDTRYGQDVTRIFSEQSSARGAEVVHSVFYDPEGTSFLQEARDLGQKKKEDDEPVIDVDAFFIPDTFRIAPLVASSLAYEEFPIGRFRTAPNVKPLGVMGLNGWNHPDIVKNSGLYLQNGVFVDAFSTQSRDETIKNFVSDFKASEKRMPSIYDAMAVDAISFAIQSTAEVPSSRSEHKMALQNARITNPITGGMRFSDSRNIERSFTIYTIKRDGIIEWAAQ